MIKIKQFFETETSTYTYIIHDEKSKEAAIIDSVYGYSEVYLKYISEKNLNLKYILETHIHADHTTDAHLLRQKTGAKVAFSKNANTSCQDIYLEDNDKLMLGEFNILTIETFGHTNTCLSFFVDNKYIFTGDALLINGSGRTDFQDGNPNSLYDSIMKIYNLADDTLIYPAHDYNGKKYSTVKEQRESNSRINISTSRDDFIHTMNNLKLPDPKHIKRSVPENLNCGNRD